MNNRCYRIGPIQMIVKNTYTLAITKLLFLTLNTGYATIMVIVNEPFMYRKWIVLFLLMFPLLSKGNHFKEDFDGGGLDDDWKCFGGAWEIKDRKYSSNACYGFAVALNAEFQSFTYQAEVQVRGNGNAGIIFSVSDPSDGRDSLNGYYMALNREKGQVYLYKIFKKPDTARRIPKGNRMINNSEELMNVIYRVEANTVYRIRVEKEHQFINVFVNDSHIISLYDRTHQKGAIGLKSDSCDAVFDNILVKEKNIPRVNYDWSWVKGLVYVPTNCVNQVQQWEEFDPLINERELSYANVYGFNMVRIYLHYLVWQKDRKKLLSDLETFLTLADSYGLKTEIIFFDDIWNKYPHLGPQEPPVPGLHNSQWMQCPGDSIKDNYDMHREKLRAYVQDVVNEHRHDKRIAFWEPYNEPGFSQEGKYIGISKRLLNDSRIWVKQTGTSIPVTSTAEPGFMGEAFSDFFTWHNYESKYGGPRGPEVLNTECMNRRDQSVPGIVENYGKQKTGYIIWELGIGRDNCRFPWDTPKDAPEVTKPFHGLIYPDGHPWDTADVAAVRGDLRNMKVFDVTYYRGSFTEERKRSIAPRIDFDLGDERGTGSPDASAGIDKDSFSIRWRGGLSVPLPGKYIFYAGCDNVARIWINDQLVVNKKTNKREELAGEVRLRPREKYVVSVEYVHAAGPASLHVYWKGPGFRKKVLLPDVR